MAFIRSLSELSLRGGHTRLVYPYTMTGEALALVRQGYDDLIRIHSPRSAAPFIRLAVVVYENPRICIPQRPYMEVRSNLMLDWSQPMEGAQMQFVFKVPAESYDYILPSGERGRMDMEAVFADFRRGAFTPPHAAQIPLAMVRVDPFTPVGQWF